MTPQPENPPFGEQAEVLDEPAATPADTRAEMLRMVPRGYVQLRNIFVQMPDRAAERSSTLARMVTGRPHRALLLYLLLLTCWPWLEGRREPLPASAWVRALTAHGGPTWSTSTLSRAWGELEELGLIEKREREGRAVRIRPRREDGARAYDAPAGRSDRMNAYFVLPLDFWLDETFAKLTLPGLAMLLIIAKETNQKSPEMWMRQSDARAWYGISQKTAQNGIKNLRDLGLVHERKQQVKAPLSSTGVTTRIWYSLTGNYGTEARRALRERANRARKHRAAAATHEASRSRKRLTKPAKGSNGGRKKVGGGARKEGVNACGSASDVMAGK